MGIQRIQMDAIDLPALLGRDPSSRISVQPSDESIKRYFSGKKALVSGAGGSIGSEICRQLCCFGVDTLIMVDASEFNLYRIDLATREAVDPGQRPREAVALLESAANREAMRAIFRQWRPDLVIHAAAFKHVPLVELNPVAAIRNNLMSTMVLAEAAQDFGVEGFLLISSDKAVNPTNVMGLTKRCCELIIQAHTTAGRNGTRFCAVRFGNVLASSGSVIPRFVDQIAKGGPVTVTHPEVTRYFMLVEEAVSLVLQAQRMALGGEIFVLDMGTPVRITAMAEKLIRMLGFRPGGDMKIEFTGLRPGEKLFEELILDGEESATLHDGIFVARPAQIDPLEVMASARCLLDTTATADARTCIKELRDFALKPRHLRSLPEFTPLSAEPAQQTAIPARLAG